MSAKSGNGSAGVASEAPGERPQPKRFWVGGATGFLGSHLVRVLLSRGHEVCAVSRTGGVVHGQEVLAVDILDTEAVAKSAGGMDGAFLATGKVSRSTDASEELHRVHVLGVRSALQGLRQAKVPRVVVASTSGTLAVGRDPRAILDERASAPLEIIARWPYYRSKYYGEREALAFDAPGFEVVVVNPSLLLGPGDVGESSTGDVRRFLERSLPGVPAGGAALVDARDAALGMLLAFERGKAGERYILNAANLTVAAYFQRLERLSGVKGPWLHLPKSRDLALGLLRAFSSAVRAIGGSAPEDEQSLDMAQHFWYCSSEKAEAELGFRPRDLGETLRDTIEDLRARGVA